MSLEEVSSPALFERDPSALPVAESLRRSSRVVVAAQVASQVLSVVTLAILYRVLGRDIFGLMAMVLAVLNLVRILVTSGLDIAAIQQAELSDRQVSALFWLNQALGLTMTVLMVIGAPLVVWFYGEPIFWLTVAMAGTAWAWVLGIQHLALLQRRLRLGTVACIRLAALAVGAGGAITAALAGWGIWALVIQQYLELAMLTVLAWVMEPWRPRLDVRGSGVGRLVRVGGHCTLSNLMFGTINNVDKMLVGSMLGASASGLYSQAFSLMQKPVTVLLTPLTSVMLPGLSRAANDRDEYRRLLLVFVRGLGLVMLPIGIGLSVVAPEAMLVLGGPQFAAGGPILAVLALSILVQGFYTAMGSVLVSAGHADRLSRWSTINAVVMCTSYFVGIHVGKWLGDPVMGVTWAYTLTLAVVVCPMYFGFTLRTVGVGYADCMRQVRMSLPAAVGMGVAVWSCRWVVRTYLGWPALALLAVEVPLGVLVYAALAWRDVRWLLHGGLRARVEGTAAVPAAEGKETGGDGHN